MTAPSINLSEAELAIVREILTRLIPDREVRVFGSRVTGRTKKFSDLDLAIMGQDPVPPATMADLREAFIESDLPIKVDLVDWATTSQTFREVIGFQCSSIT